MSIQKTTATKLNWEAPAKPANSHFTAFIQLLSLVKTRLSEYRIVTGPWFEPLPRHDERGRHW